MIRCTYILFFVLLRTCFLQGQDVPWQEKYAALTTDLNKAKNYPDTFTTYTKLLLGLTDSIAKTSYSEFLPEVKPYYEWLRVHPEVTDQIVRKQYMILGHRFNAFTTYIEEAIDCYLTAHEAGKRQSRVEDYFWVENPLATIYNMKGDHEQSLYYYNYTRKGLEQLIRDPELPEDRVLFFTSQWERVLNNIAYLHYWSRSYQKALEVLEESYQSASLSQNIKAMVFGARYEAEIHTAMQQYTEATAALTRFRDLTDLLPVKEQAGNLELYHQLSGILAMRQGDCFSAKDHFNKTLQEKNNPNRFVAKNHNRMAQAYLQCKEPMQAIYHIREGLSIFGLDPDKLMNKTQKVYEENTISELLTTVGDYYYQLFEKDNLPVYLDSVLITYQLSLQTLEMLRGQYLLEGSKALSIQETREMIERIISLHHRLNEMKGIQDGDSVWPYMAKAKNVLLSDFDRERKQINNLPKEEQASLKEMYSRIRELTSELLANQEGSSETESELVKLRKEIQQALKKGKLTNGVTQPDKTHFIEYVYTEEGLYGMDNLTGNLRLLKLEAGRGLDSVIREVQTDMKRKNSGEGFFTNLYELYRVLLQPYEPLPPQMTIYPDGALFLLPFAALIADPNKLRYVVQDHVINIGYLHEKSLRKKGNRLPLFAVAPVYPKMDGMLAYERGHLYHLPYAEEEIRSLENNWTGGYQADQSLDKESFFALLEQDGYLHFAGHALVDASGAWLALSADTTSWITYEEISRSVLGVSSVVLSACETGLGSYAPGEGVNSLAKSFLNAGVASVVYSLWTVNDQTTAILMDKYYDHLGAVDRADQALALAQRDFLDLHSGAHPYYWAAFVAADHGEVAKRNYRWLWLAAIVGLTVLIYLFYQYKSKKS